MSRRLSRISLVLVILSTSEVWALGLGEIQMNSALNEPLSARIELLSASPEELDNLKLGIASTDTFQRYGLDRSFYLSDVQFNVVRSGSSEGNYVQVRSETPMAEPFLTFLVEASWSRGRLLREYTVFLDPPSFAPPTTDSALVVQAPSRTTPSDSGRIERQAAPEQPKPQPVVDDTPYETSAGADYNVQRGETLWRIASRVSPDSRLSMNQIMLAIFEANPEAFGGNINILRAGAGLRIPSADEIFQINRGGALAEAQRQHDEWSGGTVPPVADQSLTQRLILVPPDDDVVAGGAEPDTQFGDEPLSREDEIEQRIAELEGADVPQQQSLIEIRDNELAALRQDLARIRGEIYELPVDDTAVDDAVADDTAADDAVADDTYSDPFADATDITVDDADAIGADDAAAVTDEAPAAIIRPPTRSEPTFVERTMGILNEWWMIIVGVVVIVGGFLFWFMRRGRDDSAPAEADDWRPLDSDEIGDETLEGTASLHAPIQMDESILVVEQESATPVDVDMDKTVDAPAPIFEVGEDIDIDEDEDTSELDSLEDTFSSDTAVNLDQTDPIAEADFHMAYGLYDQAADLINGALTAEPDRADLLTKLCEIYFVWGNRDAFVDAASRLNSVFGDTASADWDKIVIMGQQIAADDALFAGARAAGATKDVDLTFEMGTDDGGGLDMDFGGGDDEAGDFVDLGGQDQTQSFDIGEGADFSVGSVDDETELAEIDESFGSVDDETELAQIDESVASDAGELPDFEVTRDIPIAEVTAEINLDDLGLDVDGLAETELASLDDLDATSEKETMSDIDMNKALEDLAEITDENPKIDPDVAGVQTALDSDFDETEIATDIGIDEKMLDVTGMTQVLDEDIVPEELPDVGDEDLEITGELPSVAAVDVNLDLDNLTEALKISEAGDTIEQLATDATVEQPRPDLAKESEGDESDLLSPEDMGDELSEARTMTEVGTKLDLARAYVDMGDPNGARSILEEVLDEGDEGQRQQAQQLLDSLPS